MTAGGILKSARKWAYVGKNKNPGITQGYQTVDRSNPDVAKKRRMRGGCSHRELPLGYNPTEK